MRDYTIILFFFHPSTLSCIIEDRVKEMRGAFSEQVNHTLREKCSVSFFSSVCMPRLICPITQLIWSHPWLKVVDFLLLNGSKLHIVQWNIPTFQSSSIRKVSVCFLKHWHRMDATVNCFRHVVLIIEGCGRQVHSVKLCIPEARERSGEGRGWGVALYTLTKADTHAHPKCRDRRDLQDGRALYSVPRMQASKHVS